VDRVGNSRRVVQVMGIILLDVIPITLLSLINVFARNTPILLLVCYQPAQEEAILFSKAT